MPKRKRTEVQPDEGEVETKPQRETRPRKSNVKTAPTNAPESKTDKLKTAIKTTTTPSTQTKATSSKLTSTTTAAQPFSIPHKPNPIQCERRGNPNDPTTLVFTHGAGGGLSNPATALFAEGFAELYPVVSFQGTMNFKARVAMFSTVLDYERERTAAKDGVVALGGRSMGARAATALVGSVKGKEEGSVKALVLASYPLVGAQKGDLRDGVLLDLDEGVDALFISGSNDSMCDLKQLRTVIGKMKARSWIVEVVGADHGMSLNPKGAIEPIRRQAGKIAAEWLRDRDESKRYCTLSWNKERGAAEFSNWQESTQ